MGSQAAPSQSQGPGPRELENAPASILEQTPGMVQEVKAADGRKPDCQLERSAGKPSRLSCWATRASWAPGQEAA